MKENVARPTRLIDITGLPLTEIEETDEGGLLIGALVPNSDLAYDARIAKRYPLLSSSILAGASAQLRNMASTGGNLLQRTRCLYFYDTTTPCNKREPGSGCSAIDGFNRMNAILGWSEACIAVHPSDMCVALAVLEATIHVSGPKGDRAIPFAEFHRLPGDTPDIETTLARDEIIAAIELPAEGFAGNYSYLKIRDRLSYAFALVSVAAGLKLEAGAIKEARLALGGVAHKPWRVPDAEKSLEGQKPSRKAFGKAADVLLQGAKGFAHNSFKIELARRAIVRTLEQAAAGTPQIQSVKAII
jgi:xanthine dehydrogenase YagS FAD-binding subunit